MEKKNCRNNDGGGKLIKNDERQSLMLWDMVGGPNWTNQDGEWIEGLSLIEDSISSGKAGNGNVLKSDDNDF